MPLILSHTCSGLYNALILHRNCSQVLYLKHAQTLQHIKAQQPDWLCLQISRQLWFLQIGITEVEMEEESASEGSHGEEEEQDHAAAAKPASSR